MELTDREKELVKFISQAILQSVEPEIVNPTVLIPGVGVILEDTGVRPAPNFAKRPVAGRLLKDQTVAVLEADKMWVAIDLAPWQGEGQEVPGDTLEGWIEADKVDVTLEPYYSE